MINLTVCDWGSKSTKQFTGDLCTNKVCHQWLML